MIYVHWKLKDKFHKKVTVWLFIQVSGVWYSSLGDDKISLLKLNVSFVPCTLTII